MSDDAAEPIRSDVPDLTGVPLAAIPWSDAVQRYLPAAHPPLLPQSRFNSSI